MRREDRDDGILEKEIWVTIALFFIIIVNCNCYESLYFLLIIPFRPNHKQDIREDCNLQARFPKNKFQK